MKPALDPRSLLRALGFAAALLAAGTAHAQLFRAYLAVSGKDANPCTLPQPCRLLPAALNAVADGGEVWMLDSANYNTATVNVAKSVTILAVPGAVGSVLATGGPAIAIATPGVSVVLRNLVIVPLPGAGGTNGVAMTAGQSLTVEKSLLSGLAGAGVYASGDIAVKVVDTTIRGLGHGIRLENGPRATVTRSVLGVPAGATHYAFAAIGSHADTLTTASLEGCTIEGSYTAVLARSMSATATVRVAVRDSQVDRNFYGLYAHSEAGGTVVLAASGNDVTGTTNEAIIAFGAGARAWAAGNSVTGNGMGLVAASGGIVESAGDNAVRNNTNDTIGAITVVAKE